MHVNIFVISKEITNDLALNLLQDGRTKMCSAGNQNVSPFPAHGKFKVTFYHNFYSNANCIALEM